MKENKCDFENKGITTLFFLFISAFLHLAVFSAFWMWAQNAEFEKVIFNDLEIGSLILDKTNSTVVGKDFKFYENKNLEEDFSGKKQIKNNVETFKADCPHPCPDNQDDWIIISQSNRPPILKNPLAHPWEYPEEARRRNLTGVVTIEVYIDALGKVKKAELLNSAHDILDEFVLTKIKTAVFFPALDKNLKPVACRFILPVELRLKDYN
jgi:TonB family protein